MLEELGVESADTARRSHAQRYAIRIDSQQYEISDPVVTGQQLLDLADKRPADQFLIYQILRNGQYEDIRLDETVDLRQGGIERFVTSESDRSFRLVVDGRRFDWPKPLISGLQLKEFAGVDPNLYAVWQEIPAAEDHEITSSDLVDLQAPGVERFFTCKKQTTEG